MRWTVAAAGAAAGTVVPIVVAAAAVGAVARVCATSEKHNARGNEDHCVTSVSTEHHTDVPSSTSGCSRIGSDNIHVLAGGVEDE